MKVAARSSAMHVRICMYVCIFSISLSNHRYCNIVGIVTVGPVVKLLTMTEPVYGEIGEFV